MPRQKSKRAGTAERQTPDQAVKVRGHVYDRLKEIGRTNRMYVADVIDVLANGWGMLTPEQQLTAIQQGTKAARAA